MNKPIRTACSHVWKLIYDRIPGLMGQACWKEIEGKASLIWKPNSLGKFTVKQWKRMNQNSHQNMPWFLNIWNIGIPPKMSLLFWRIFHNGVPTDDNITKLHIAYTSKCRCCLVHDQESLNHLMLHSHLADKTWSKLCKEFNIKIARVNIQHFMRVWIKGANLKSQFEFIRVATCITAFCFMWDHRN